MVPTKWTYVHVVGVTNEELVCMFFIYSMKKSVSQNFDTGLSLCFIVCRRWKFDKIIQNILKVTLFCHKMKTKA